MPSQLAFFYLLFGFEDSCHMLTKYLVYSFSRCHVICCMTLPKLNSFLGGHLGSFQFFLITNTTIINIRIHVFLYMCTRHSMNGISGHRICESSMPFNELDRLCELVLTQTVWTVSYNRVTLSFGQLDGNKHDTEA